MEFSKYCISYNRFFNICVSGSVKIIVEIILDLYNSTTYLPWIGWICFPWKDASKTFKCFTQNSCSSKSIPGNRKGFANLWKLAKITFNNTTQESSFVRLHWNTEKFSRNVQMCSLVKTLILELVIYLMVGNDLYTGVSPKLIFNALLGGNRKVARE